MNDSKLKQLFATVRREPPPEAPFNFDQAVVSAIQGESRRRGPLSLSEQLSQWFPRVAVGALLVIAFCVVTEFYLTEKQVTSPAEFQQAAEDWLFAAK